MKNIAIIDSYNLMAETVYGFIEDILDDLDKSDEFKISTYSDARVALEELGSGDIAISDIDMSGKMNGLDFAEGAKQSGINVILSSGNPEYKDRVSGKFPFLSKPYLYEDLSTLINFYLNGDSGREESIGVVVIGYENPEDCELYCNSLSAELEERGFIDAVVVGYPTKEDYFKSNSALDTDILIDSEDNIKDLVSSVLDKYEATKQERNKEPAEGF